MRANGRILAAQAQACLAASGSSGSSCMRSLTLRMARTSIVTHTRSTNSLRLLHTSSSSLSASAAVESSKSVDGIEVQDIPIPAAVEATADLSAPLVEETSSTSTTTTAQPSQPDITLPLGRWTPASRRVGLIAKKAGMTTYFMPDGRRVGATVLHVTSNVISAHIGFSVPETNSKGAPISPEKAAARMAYTALQVAATNASSINGISRAQRGHLRKAGIKEDKKILHEFKVTKDALVPLGTQLSAAHFVPGQHIDVQGITRGKGFQGPMKRHGFKGQPASHGTSLAHRSHGSTGMNQDPGRVFPGKKMAGHMGVKTNTKSNLEVLRVDVANDLIVVQGNVPGPEGGHVFLRDSKKLVRRASGAYSSGKLPDHKGMATGQETAEVYLPEGVSDLPFPTLTREMAKLLPDVIEVGPKATKA